MRLNYCMPTKMLMEENVVLNHKDLLKAYGEKALIVTGKTSAKKTGALDDVLEALDELNIKAVLFDEIEENPSTQTVAKAAEIGKREGVDFIIGIGGGSPLDAAKAIGVMIHHPHVTEETLFTTERLKSIPIIAIPTTSGTGSETTPYAILTDHSIQTKKNLGQKIFCEIAFLDVRYTETMPYGLTLNTAIDAMTHLVESYLNINSNFMSEIYVQKGLELWGECIPSLKSGHFTREVREKLMLASTLGGVAITVTGTSLPHGMGYALTYFKDVPHGLANGIVFNHYLACFKDTTKLQKMCEWLGISSLDVLNQFLDEVISVNIEVSEEEIASWSQGMWENKGKLKNHPEQVDYDTIYEIYKKSLM